MVKVKRETCKRIRRKIRVGVGVIRKSIAKEGARTGMAGKK